MEVFNKSIEEVNRGNEILRLRKTIQENQETVINSKKIITDTKHKLTDLIIKNISCDDVICGVQMFMEVDIYNETRVPKYVRGRQYAFHLMIYYATLKGYSLSLLVMGKLLNKTHSNVIWSLTNAEKFIETESDYREDIEEIKKLIES